MRSSGSSAARLRVLLASMLALSTAAYVGCSDDEVSPPTDGSDGGSTTSTAEDAATDVRRVEDAAADAAPVCTDPVFDCTRTAGNANVDDAGTPVGLSANAASVPFDIRCSGLYACFSTKTVAATHASFSPAYKLYSDGAEKQRWLYLPPGTTIDVGGGDAGGTVEDFVFPVGTAVYKEFQIAGKRVETRRIWKAAVGEYVYSVYRWADDESTAVLTFSGALVPNAVRPGKPYEIPPTTNCAGCHAGHADKLLGLDAWGLGGGGATGLSLASLKSEGRLAGWTSQVTTLNVTEDATGKFKPALAFYYNNCGFCHKPGGVAGGTGLHLNLPVAAALADGGTAIKAEDTPLYKTAVNVAHNNTGGGTYTAAGGYKRIVPKDADHSILFIRDSLRSADGGIATAPFAQMPNSIVRTTDEAGLAATRDWINALP